jgi:ankyrin repeat protein
VFCQLDRLRRCLLPRIRQAINELPETLDETYERTLLDIGEENWAFAHRLFQCIVVARRPLRVEELAEFLAFNSDTGGSLTFQRDWRPENPRDTVLSTCSSLISIVYVDGSAVMQFSHFSVKEYLTSSRIAEGRVSRYYIPLEPAHIFVTQACLSVLLEIDDHVTRSVIDEFPLARYAARYWTKHGEFGDVASHAEDLMKRLFNPEGHHFANWVRMHDTFPSGEEKALHYAARHGFHRVVEWLIMPCSQDASILGFNGWTPIHTASRYGQLMVVQVLLKHHADVNVVTGSGWTPLHHAMYKEHPNVARLLLERVANVDIKDRAGRTPLRLLSEYSGNLEVARLLLERGADPSVRCKYGRDSLYMAILKGHQSLVQLLVKHGADPSALYDDGRTLLHVSSENGELEVTRRLLELGVDVNSRNKQGRTPLQVTSAWRNKEQIEQLLSQYGAQRT